MNRSAVPLSEISASDLLRCADEMEKRAVMLYSALSGKVQDKKLSALFHTLEQEELMHSGLIEKTLIPSLYRKNSPPDAWMSQLYAYASGRLYPKEILTEKIRRISDPETIFEMAISMELDSILFYQEIRDQITAESAPFVDRLIAEERNHFYRLLQMKTDYGA